MQVLGPETTAYLVAALNPPGVCARGLSGVLLKAVQSPSPIPLFVAQRSEDIIKREPTPQTRVSLRPAVPPHAVHMSASDPMSLSCNWGLMQLPCQDQFEKAVLPWKGGPCRLCCLVPCCNPRSWLMISLHPPELHAVVPAQVAYISDWICCRPQMAHAPSAAQCLFGRLCYSC